MMRFFGNQLDLEVNELGIFLHSNGELTEATTFQIFNAPHSLKI